MKRIKLSKNKYAIIDEEDYRFLKNFNWRAVKKDRDWYAITAIRTTKKHESAIVYMHQFLIKLDNCECITFKNKNTLDNRKNNLFGVSRGVSQARQRKRRTNGDWELTSVYKGVSHRKRKNKEFWEARISKNKKTYWLGMFKTEKEAAEAYNKKAKELYGEFAFQNNLNKPR